MGQHPKGRDINYNIITVDTAAMVASNILSRVKTYQLNRTPKGDDMSGKYDIDASQYLGQLIQTDVTLTVDDYQTEEFDRNTNSYRKVTIQGSTIQLKAVLVDVSISKEIVTTTIAGQSGTIKEYICDGDYQISFQGVIAADYKKEYPLEDVKSLQAIRKAAVPVAVTSELLNNVFGVYNIVVTDFGTSQQEGVINAMYFTMDALSDSPLELKI